MDIAIVSERFPGSFGVRVEVRLSARETSRLFVGGDVLVQLPLDGAISDGDSAPIPRSGMFLSEIAGTRGGVVRRFADEASALSFAAAVRAQLDSALEGS